jgi:hypothetical protein
VRSERGINNNNKMKLVGLIKVCLNETSKTILHGEVIKKWQ